MPAARHSPAKTHQYAGVFASTKNCANRGNASPIPTPAAIIAVRSLLLVCPMRRLAMNVLPVIARTPAMVASGRCTRHRRQPLRAVYPNGYDGMRFARFAPVEPGAAISGRTVLSMMSFSVDTAACDRSPGCPARRACPKGAITALPGGAYPGANGYTVNEALCAGCGICVRVCPGHAVSAK